MWRFPEKVPGCGIKFLLWKGALWCFNSCFSFNEKQAWFIISFTRNNKCILLEEGGNYVSQEVGLVLEIFVLLPTALFLIKYLNTNHFINLYYLYY